MRHLITVVEDLRGRGVGFRSLNEGAIDTTCASGELIFNIFSALAQFERRLIQERTKAGLDRARARGVRLGRRPASVRPAEVLNLKQQGHSLGQIARSLRCSRATVRRRLQEASNGT